MREREEENFPLRQLDDEGYERRRSRVKIGREEIGIGCTLPIVMQLCEVANRRIDLDLNSVDWQVLVEKHLIARAARRLNQWTFGIAQIPYVRRLRTLWLRN